MEKTSHSQLHNEQLWLLTGGILLIAFVAFSFAMYFTRSFMIPFVFSVFLCAMVSPVDNYVVNHLKMPRWVGFTACMTVILFLFFCIFFVGKYAIGSINKAINAVDIKFPTVESTAPPVISSGIPDLTPDAIPLPGSNLTPAHPILDESGSEAGENVGGAADAKTEVPKEVSISASDTPVEENTSQMLEETIDYLFQKVGLDSEYVNAETIISSIYSYIPTILRGSIATCQTFISFSTMVLLYSLFILMGRNPKMHINNEVYNEVEFSIQKYLNIKFFISLATGICIYIIFLCLGAPMAFLFGLLAFVLNFIPSIGSIIATVLPLPIVLLTMDMSHTGLFLAFFLPCVVQNVLGNFLDPKLQGEGLQLHPVTILLALGYWGVVWGIFGMLLAAPMTAALRIILLEFKTTQWIAQLMGGKIPSMKEVLEINE